MTMTTLGEVCVVSIWVLVRGSTKEVVKVVSTTKVYREKAVTTVGSNEWRVSAVVSMSCTMSPALSPARAAMSARSRAKV